MARPTAPGFFANDASHAPFGIAFLRGITPARFAVFVVLCMTPGIVTLESVVGRSGLTWDLAPLIYRRTMGTLYAAFPLLTLVVWADRATTGAAVKGRIAAFAAAVLAGSALFTLLLLAIPVLVYEANWRAYPTFEMIPVHFYKAAMAGGIGSAVLFMMARERDAQRRLQQTRLAQVAVEREIVEARLQLLNAQIEPHFLFNSLASVKRLYEQGPGGGRELLLNLGSYLRAAVDRGRRRECTLGEEVDLASDFLKILGLRMGERLSLCIDVPNELRHAMIPPLMLGTLVENAVKHGIGPRGAGGTISITASSAEERLVLEVADDGVGFRAESGTGVGLANTRARLGSLYGVEGALELARNAAGGVTATIRLPLRLSRAPVAAAPPSASVTPAGPGATTPSRGAGFLARALRIITWKHWAWAVGIGAALAAIDRVRAIPARHMLGFPWLFETYYDIACACLFMLAIVAVEAWRRGARPPQGSHYAAGAFAAAGLSLALLAAYPMPVPAGSEPKTEREGRAAQTARSRSHLNRVAAQISGIGMVTVVHGLLGTVIYVWSRNARRAAAALAEAEIERVEANRRLLESRLEAVQSELDPSFLFKTLDAVGDAYAVDRKMADAMLDELIAFLRAAIPKVRVADTGAGQPLVAATT